jgi:hypothetical protein
VKSALFIRRQLTRGRRSERPEVAALGHVVEMNLRNAGIADSAADCERQIDIPAPNERSAVVDADDDAAGIAQIGDPYHRAEWQGAVRRREPARIVGMTVGRARPPVFAASSGGALTRIPR